MHQTFLYVTVCTRDRRWVHKVYGAIFRGLISYTAMELAAFIFSACGSVTPGSPLMWQEKAQTRMRQREWRLRDSNRWKCLQWELQGGRVFSLGVGLWEGWENEEDQCEFAGSRVNRWSHHLTDLLEFALRAGWWWVQKGCKAEGGKKGLGDCDGLGEGTTVARADRDVSAASVISRRLNAARGHRGAHRSRGVIE